jgi:hypothetical protein
MKNNQLYGQRLERVKDSVLGIAGVILASACVGVALYYHEMLFLLFIVIVMGVLPAVYTVRDTITGRYDRSFNNFFALLLFYYLSAWYSVLVVIIIFPGIVFSVIAGPIAAVLFTLGAAILGAALAQWISGSRLGFSDMRNAGTVIVGSVLVLACGGLLYLRFLRKGEPIDEMISRKLADLFDEFLQKLKQSTGYMK